MPKLAVARFASSSTASLTALTLVVGLYGFVGCGGNDDAPPPNNDAATDVGDGCLEASDVNKAIRFDTRLLVVAPGEKRTVRVYIEPDVCSPQSVPIKVEGAAAKVEGTFDPTPAKPETTIDVIGVSAGATKVSATWGARTATIDVEVRAKDLPTCAPDASGKVAPAGSLKAGTAALAVAAGATRDPASIDPLDEASTVEPFDATISCKPDGKGPDGFAALGPAVTFGPSDKKFLRELTFEVPINPAIMPPAGKLRHVRMQYSSNSLKTPRFVPMTNPRIERRDTGFVLRFEAPRLGTYQPFVATNAGTVKKKRKLTHRAVFGFSMGGIGSSMFGMNHHDMFDVVAPLGGPMDAGHFLAYSFKNHYGGFCERKAGDPIPTTPCKADVGKPTEMYQHVQTYENWWHQKGVDGTGGTFGRDQMVNIFRDVAAAWGNPASTNTKYPWVAAGIDPPAPLIEDTGPGAPDYCKDPTKATIAKTGYFDKRFNPDGKLPVIKVCDGASKPGEPGKWAPGGQKPLEMVVAVDYNGNGVRDEGEPTLVQPWEPFDDFGSDGKASKDEAGYDPVTNPDPAGDDYDPQYNPLGTEGNNHLDTGEKFEDVGLDGVKCPSGETCKYDSGEGNGKFDLATGLQTFFDRDARFQLNGWSKAPVGGAWDDKALDALDYYSDGGIRDIFNWGTVGYHYLGGFVARNRPTMIFNDWTYLPNVKIDNNEAFDPKELDFTALSKTTYLRYGNIDATNRNIEKGDGQHVGYADQVFRRIQTGLFYIGSRWPDGDRTFTENPPDVDGLGPCEGTPVCTYDFKDGNGRSGPVTVILPPGYHNPANKGLKYPTVYFLHGYGQSPEDLQAFVLLVTPFMNQGLSSKATRLPKMIMVFVDGRCRGDSKNPECARGTFYVDSVKTPGAKMDKYFLDLINHVEGKYRVQGPTEIEEVE